MKTRHLTIATASVAASLFGVSAAVASEKPPADSLPLAEIVTTIESQGYAPITEISMDDGVWEVEAYKNNEERELRVDPMNGNVLSDRRDD